MSRYLPPTRSAVTAEQCFGSFRRAAPELAPAALLLVTAQTLGVEAGGGSSVRAFNLGGAKAYPRDGHDWTFFGTRDPAGPHDATIVPHKPPSLERQPLCRTADAWAPDATWSERMTCFRAYESLDAATADHVAMMKRSFPKSWAWLARVDIAPAFASLDFAHQLKAEGYFADPRVVEYGNAIRMWVKRYGDAMPSWRADA